MSGENAEMSTAEQHGTNGRVRMPRQQRDTKMEMSTGANQKDENIMQVRKSNSLCPFCHTVLTRLKYLIDVLLEHFDFQSQYANIPVIMRTVIIIGGKRLRLFRVSTVYAEAYRHG